MNFLMICSGIIFKISSIIFKKIGMDTTINKCVAIKL